MKGEKRQEWIDQGYHMVSESGFKNLNIESIARAVLKSKSSFYHYFGDIEFFEKELLNYHLQRSEGFARNVAGCGNIFPGLVDVFMEHKTDMFFHKELRINRNNPECKNCFEKVYEIFEIAIIDKWAVYFGLSRKKLFAKTFLRFITEHFLFQITPENYTRNYLIKYLEEVTEMLRQMNAGED